jgi:hypothetical protein
MNNFLSKYNTVFRCKSASPFPTEELIAKMAGFWFKSGETESLIYDQAGYQNRELAGGQIFTGKAKEFNGTTQQATFASSVNYGTQYTISCWMNPDDQSSILGKSDERVYGMSITPDISPGFDAVTHRVDGGVSSFNVDIVSGWNHYVIVRNGTNIKFYSNGVYRGEDTHPNNSDFIVDQLIGTQAADRWLDGKIYDLRIFKTNLTEQSDIDKLLIGEYVGTEYNWWWMEEDSGNTSFIYDAIKNNNLTAVNFDAGSFVSNLNHQSISNKYGYTIDGSTWKPVDATTIVDNVPTKDIDGNDLTFYGQAQYHLIKIDADTIQLPDHIYELIQATESILGNDWYDSNGNGNEIDLVDINVYEKSKQYYKDESCLIIIRSDLYTLTDDEDLFLKSYVSLASPENELWFLIGQSNATQRGVLSEIESEYTGAFNFEVYHRQSPSIFTEGDQFEVVDTDESTQMGTPDFDTTNFAINHILSAERSNLNKKTFFIHYAIGGTKVYQDAVEYDWNANSDEYTKWFTDIVALAKAELTSRGISYTEKSIIDFQGESDGLDETESLAYKQNKLDQYADIRLAIPDVHIYICKTNDRGVGYYDSNIRTAQEEIAAADANITLIDLDDVFIGDATHLDSEGYRDAAKLINETDISNNGL